MSGDKVLVLGSGMVAGPLVEYLLESGFQVTVASRTVSKARALVEGWSNGEAKHLNAKDTGMMREEINKHHLTVSLLPPRFHTVPARICTEEGKPMVTTSYVSEEMEKLDKKAKEAGVILLNELGVDPGIDHMSAVKTIDEIHRKGGQVKSFKSYCGALPAPEESFNPLGYKFSWRPKGVLHASTNPARFLVDGQEINIDGPDLFANYSFKEIGGLGYFEEYPNRDSFPYIDKYGISETETIYRGTLRNIGWCETLKKIVELGYLGGDKRDLEGMTYRDFTRKLLSYNGDDLRKGLSKQLKLDTYSTVLKTFEWLGMMGEEDIPLKRGSALEVLATLMESKLTQKKGERDMVIMQHEFKAEYPEKENNIISTFIDYGDPEGFSSVAKTVGLPAAIGAKLVLGGKFDLTGVHIPVLEEIYFPILKELEGCGIKFEEKVEKG